MKTKYLNKYCKLNTAHHEEEVRLCKFRYYKQFIVDCPLFYLLVNYKRTPLGKELNRPLFTFKITKP